MGRITVRLDDDFINKLKAEAQKNELTLSDMVRVKLTEKNKINKRNKSSSQVTLLLILHFPLFHQNLECPYTPILYKPYRKSFLWSIY